MENAASVIKYLGTFVALLLVVVSLSGLYNSLNSKITIFEGVTIALLSVGIILMLTLYYRVEQLTRAKKKKR
ncbi:MAG: hypothetical protein HY366_01185 [Candidatus Aenigmarchaeota archaeon]|nr:hypothetical protein [Candidatus Aenigmarchaeota archaeon]